MLRTLIAMPVHTDLELVGYGSLALKYWGLAAKKQNNGLM